MPSGYQVIRLTLAISFILKTKTDDDTFHDSEDPAELFTGLKYQIKIFGITGIFFDDIPKTEFPHF